MSKILLVEDDSNLREIFEMRLQAEGFQTVTAGDGEEGLTVAVREKPDLIISDVMMPKISGFEMLENLRAVPEMKETKVIMMTALGQAEDQSRGEKLGVVKYLVKSQVTLEDFARVVHEVLGDGGGSSAAPAANTSGTANESGPSSNKQESEGNMPEDATNPTPTNPSDPAAAPAADASAPAANPISGDAQTSSQEQNAVQDQINSFVAGAPSGAPDMPASDTPAAPASDPAAAPAADASAPADSAAAASTDTSGGPAVPPATDSPAGAPTPAPAEGPTPPADASATPPADPGANAI